MGSSFTETFLQSVVQAAAVVGSTATVFYLYFTTLSYYFNVEYQFVSGVSQLLVANWDFAVQTLGKVASPPEMHLKIVFNAFEVYFIFPQISC
jgi:hypothetical protein